MMIFHSKVHNAEQYLFYFAVKNDSEMYAINVVVTRNSKTVYHTLRFEDDCFFFLDRETKKTLKFFVKNYFFECNDAYANLKNFNSNFSKHILDVFRDYEFMNSKTFLDMFATEFKNFISLKIRKEGL